MEQMKSLGLTFDIDALGFETYETDNCNSNSSDAYLKNKISLEEIRDLANIESDEVDELERQFMKSYEEASMAEDVLFDRWKDEDHEDMIDDNNNDEEGDFDEPCYDCDEDYFDAAAAYDENENYCQQGN